jgi:hypothetical protein
MGGITEPAKQITIGCDVEDALPLDSIIEFQGEFKKRDRYDIENLIKSLMKYGISFPFFIWRDADVNYCMDGHGRKTALSQLRDRGYEIPDVPVVFIYAKNREEAVQKLLRLNSRYGVMTEDSVVRFIGEMPVEFSEIAIPDMEIIQFTDIYENLDQFFEVETPEKKKPPKICPYCGGILK